MIKKFIVLYLMLLSPCFLKGATASNTSNTHPMVASQKRKKMVWFRYKDVPLIEMVNDLATKRNVNIMLPQGANALTAKVTFELSHKITIERAWQYMITILKLAGFTIVPDKACSYVVKNDANVNREAFPLYIGVPPKDLPNTDLKIRYLRYLALLQVPGASSGGSSSLQTLFSQMLSPNSSVIYEPQVNAVLLTDTARNIKSVMTIVDELDASATVQEPEFVELKYTPASQVKTLLTSLIAGQGSTPQTTTGGQSGYFTQGTKIVAEDRLNTLILLGKKEALTRIADFIRTYIDVPPENGKSILHTYDLQYLQAENFAPILTQIVQNESGNNQGTQSTSSGGSIGNRLFQGVIITSETSGYGGGEGEEGSSLTPGSQTGNRLIIAALKDDWLRIEKLIQELDKPQLQVMIHALIVDLSSTAAKDFANQVRNYKDYFVKDTNWQTGHIAGIENNKEVRSEAPTDTNALMANLLPVTSTGFATGNIASNATSGSFILSFKDPKTNGIWWVSKILGRHTDSKILSQPFLTTVNNKEVQFYDTVQRYLPGASSQQFGVAVSTNTPVEASIQLNVTPRINSEGSINLSLYFDISQFTGANNARDTRTVTTSVNLQDKDILILGGHTKTKVEDTVYKTPLLGDVPILGNLFKSKSKIVTKTNLMIFLRPEIIHGSGQNITERFFNKADKLLNGGEENFALLQDPVTRWFFGKNPEGVSSKKLQSFKGHPESEREKQLRKKRTSIPMPEPRKEDNAPKNNLIKAKHPEPIKRKRPSEEPPINQEDEEKQAELELKRLFAWAEEEKVEEEETEAADKHEDHYEESPGHSEAPVNQEDEEKQADLELQKLFQNEANLKRLLQKEDAK